MAAGNFGVMAKLIGKKALITGASSGIGAAVARAYAAEGADVALNHPGGAAEADAEALAAEIRKTGAVAGTIRADVSDELAVSRLIPGAIEMLGGLDILVNNAGITTVGTVEVLSPVDWDRVLAVNLRGVFLCCRAALPHFYAQGHGRIINTASQLAYKGAPGFSHYAASKGAMLSFTRSLALEAIGKGVSVNAVAPGATETPILGDVSQEALAEIAAAIPRGRLARPEEIAPSYVFLASEDAAHYVGQTISPNGGDVLL